jgi:hypothetical protein
VNRVERVIQELRDLAAERDLQPGIGFLLGRMADDLDAEPIPAAEPILTTHHLDGTKTVHVARTSVKAKASGGRPLGAPGRRAAQRALAAMAQAAEGWAEGAAENEEAMGHRDRKPSDEQPFVLADILRMIDDAAREVGVTPTYSERSKKP